MNLGETVTYCCLKGCSYAGPFLYRCSVSTAFGGRAGFDVDPSHIFPQGLLAAITLVGGGARDGEARAGAQCEAGLPFCSVAVTALPGVGSEPKLLEQKP